MSENSPSVQLRSGLEFSRQQHQGKTFVVVKDPVTTRYFRFTETQAAILDLLLEPIEPAALSERASEKLGGTISVATIEGFLKSLEDKWLLDTPSVRKKLATVEGQKLQDRNLLYWKIASINPKRFLPGCCLVPGGPSPKASMFLRCFRSRWVSF